MKSFFDIAFKKVFGLFRALFFIFLAYCTTIISTADYSTSLMIVVVSLVIIVIIICRYVYIRNDKKVRDVLKTGLTDIIRNGRNDIINTTKMMVVDFFTVIISLFILIAFLKRL